MKTVIYYFSATGNTARAVQAIAERLKAAGQDVSLQTVDVQTDPPREIPDLTMVAFPIWSWAAPHFILNFTRHLPRAKGAKAAVFSTCGGFGAQGIGEVERLLKRRGYTVVCSGEAAYPDNWVLAVDPPTGEELNTALAEGDGGVQLFINNCLSESPAKYRCAFLHKLWSWPISRLFRMFGRRFLGKIFIADATCTSCGICARDCPVQAIRLSGSPAAPRWNASCAACYRCINLCPVQAIQISIPLMIVHLGLNLVLTILCLGSIGWIHRQLPPMVGLAQWGMAVVIALAVLVTLSVLQLTALDRWVHGLATRLSLRGFFLRSYTRSFGRYRAPGFRPGSSPD